VLLAAATVLAFALVLLLAELLARVLHPGALDDQPQASLARLHRFSPVYGWELRPLARTQVDGHLTTINRLGQRGPEHALARTAGRRRVLMLGDSVGFGYGVGDGETLGARLEERGYEVVNLSVPGYGTDQELLRLEREAAAWRADVVLVHFCVENDFVDNVSPRFFYDGLHPKPFFTLREGTLALHDDGLRLSGPARAALWLREHSYLLQWARPRAPAPATDWAARKAAALGDGTVARALTVALLQRLARTASAQGARLVVAVHPSRESFHAASTWAETVLQAPLGEGAGRIDMAAAYRERGERFRDLTLDSIGHLGPHGQAVAADVLAPALSP
jgi:hypothetical protein